MQCIRMTASSEVEKSSNTQTIVIPSDAFISN